MGECSKPVQLHVGEGRVTGLDLADLGLSNAGSVSQLGLRHVWLLVLAQPLQPLVKLLEA